MRLPQQMPGPNADIWDWQLQGLCRGLDSSVFFSPDGERGRARAHGAVAQAIGMFGRRVEQPADLEQALADAFTYDGPAVVDVVTARQELSIPPAISAQMAEGFTAYAIRTILAGRADELLDLVTTNVARRILD